jgi:aldose 1-epimerase
MTAYGNTGDGKTVTAHTLRRGRLTATVLDLGGIITAITVDGRNVVLGLDGLAAYEASGSWNCVIGRYANRLKNGFTLDGTHYPLKQDANGVTLHGGKGQSWGARVWDVMETNDSVLTLRLVSPDGDQGFPGMVTADVTYTLDDDGLRLDYRAVTDAATPINLTNHLYFNLAGEGPVTAQLLQVNADAMTPTDAQQIPTGKIAAVAGTAFDFRAPVPIGTRVDSQETQMTLARGLDHNFVLNHSAPGALEWAARLTDPASGLVLEVLTSEPGIQVYSTNNVKGTQRNVAGAVIQPRDGLALETQHFPDSPNQPAFPTTILRPGETWHSTTVFRFP